MKRMFLLLGMLVITTSGQGDYDLLKEYQDNFALCDSALQYVMLVNSDSDYEDFARLTTIAYAREMYRLSSSSQLYIGQIQTLLLCYDEMKLKYDKEVIGFWIYSTMLVLQVHLYECMTRITELLSTDTNQGLVRAANKLKNTMGMLYTTMSSMDDKYQQYFEDPAPFRE